ncbi:HEAT repeat domain-containing protein [Granulicella arctica]|uniref:HEAT repeat domain-containing protein n=1 Tax=Granulicella arctica TaxID=940613 RepID=A0A7Y9TI66_9BACT|nr:HEAT repeat domain-containing protein [Granulicella arctica]NYF81264.1 hypothetical protein [Granulicella arctica]
MKRTTLLPHLRSSLAAGLCVALLALSSSSAFAQDTSKTTTSDDSDTPAPTFDPLHSTAAQDSQQAWSMLTDAVNDPKHPDLRIEGLAALGTMGNNLRATTMIVAAMKDTDVDVRTAAVLAAGQTKNRSLTTNLRNMLDDKEPQVAFSAAITLSKMGDRSGEDILIAVVDGDRKANASLVNGTMHTVNKDLHNPTSLAKMGALQGASMLLGPFGFGITAYEYMRKNGGESSRVTAIEELSKIRTEPIRKEFVAALDDKDPGVRAAAAKALGEYHDKPTAAALLNLFSDSKPPVRLTAAAAYLRSTGQSTLRANKK